MKATKFEKMYNGFHWLFENDYGETVSVIQHDFSYGHSVGLFEVQTSWDKDDVHGYQGFDDVSKFIRKLINRERKRKKGEGK